ncbi:hypothetical protein MTHERMMSTA1_18950 [Methanosarcina thermophila MST-A1]|uniref:Na+/H+ antiporter NhaD-like permease n=1 Tax=Methanosarcina thermophila TaxID=2210 RepID=A0A3G9CWX6_METTE|nr:Na+/H+ antiporter NhaD-like permease [Methanosarcina thermophila]GLI14769.1 hypothetical protein MTHERMMSTA1_18950 [Methanosarcina thermophila MST-A1]
MIAINSGVPIIAGYYQQSNIKVLVKRSVDWLTLRFFRVVYILKERNYIK